MNQTGDVRSKFVDGLLSFVLILAGTFVLIRSFRLVRLAGIGGFIVYAGLALALSIWCLVHSQKEKLSELAQGWYGTLGGFFGWTFIELGHLEFDFISIEDWDGSTLFVLAVLALVVLWRYLPTGPRFWVTIFGLNWGGHIVIKAQRVLFGPTPTLDTAFVVTSIICGLLFVGDMYWIFTRTKTRVQRFWGAVWAWLFVIVIMFAIRG